MVHAIDPNMGRSIAVTKTISVEETWDATPSPSSNVNSDPHVSLVQGGSLHLSDETQSLLHRRLRAAALILFIGFTAFLLADLTGLLGGFGDGGFWYRVFHVAVAVTLAGSAGLLCRTSPSAKTNLRLKEAVVFGLPSAFLLVAQFHALRVCAHEHHYMPSPIAPWIMLMFTYALYIPNTWQRATVGISAMALAPLALILGLWATDQACAAVMSATVGSTGMVHLFLSLSVAAGSSIFGVRTIGHLQREAFRAKRLGHYFLKERLGAGGMGEVYLAEHVLLKRPCAVKVIRPERAGDPRALARFEREVRATAELSHWNTIDVYDYGMTDDGTFFYVMEYLPGQSLSQLVKAHGPLPTSRAIYLLRQTCQALKEAHGAGLIHRDIKPANIFAAYRGGQHDVAKLLDFGLAKPMAKLESSELTLDGAITGSPLFASPEQALGDVEPDARSDIYSLGAVAYYLVAGRAPFANLQPLRVLMAHVHDPVEPPSLHRPDLPEDFERFIQRCLEKSPEDRFQNVDEMIQALDACQDARGWNPQRAEAWWKDHGSILKAAPLGESLASRVATVA